MKESTPIVEYGAAIDPRVMVEPPDAAQLELEPGHPGLGDAAYVKRRHELFALCRHGPAESVAGVIDRALELGGPVMDDFLEAGPAERQAAVSRAGGMKSGPWGEGR